MKLRAIATCVIVTLSAVLIRLAQGFPNNAACLVTKTTCNALSPWQPAQAAGNGCGIGWPLGQAQTWPAGTGPNCSVVPTSGALAWCYVCTGPQAGNPLITCWCVAFAPGTNCNAQQKVACGDLACPLCQTRTYGPLGFNPRPGVALPFDMCQCFNAGMGGVYNPVPAGVSCDVWTCPCPPPPPLPPGPASAP
jgi:hypothetical protein